MRLGAIVRFGWALSTSALAVVQGGAPNNTSDSSALSSGSSEHPRSAFVLVLAPGLPRGESCYERPRSPLRIGFLRGDSALTGQAKRELRWLSDALQEGPLAEARVRLEGYAEPEEASGPDAARRLALRRALAVRDFLVDGCGLESTRFELQGYEIVRDGPPKRDPGGTVEIVDMERGRRIQQATGN